MDLNEILRDLNVTIADVETMLLEDAVASTKTEFKRAIGQLKAARASLVLIAGKEQKTDARL